MLTVLLVLALSAACTAAPAEPKSRQLQELFVEAPELVTATPSGLEYGTPQWNTELIAPDNYPANAGVVLSLRPRARFDLDAGDLGAAVPMCLEILFRTADTTLQAREMCTDIAREVLYWPGPLGSYGYDGFIEVGPLDIPSEPFRVAVRARLDIDNAVCTSYPGYCSPRLLRDGLARMRWPSGSSLASHPEIASLTSVSVPSLYGQWVDGNEDGFLPLPVQQLPRYTLDASHYPEGAGLKGTVDAWVGVESTDTTRDSCVRLVGSGPNSGHIMQYTCTTFATDDTGAFRTFHADAISLQPVALGTGPHTYTTQLDPVNWLGVQPYASTSQTTKTTVSW